MTFRGERIWIVGASSGIGAALALELAGEGAQIIASARREAALADLVRSLPGDGHTALPLDIGADEAVMKAALSIAADGAPLHRIVCLAAIYTPTRFADLTLDEVRRSLSVNVLGNIALACAARDLFQARGFGQLALCASVAGYCGLPRSQPYGAGKAALINFCESLRCECEPFMDIKLINPGFVETRLTEKNDFHMPMRISAQKAARAISLGLRGRRFEIHFPPTFTLAMKFLAVLPYWAQFPILKRINATS